jgi:hypothetical protein
MRGVIMQFILFVAVTLAPLCLGVLVWKRHYRAAVTYLFVLSAGPLAMFAAIEVTNPDIRVWAIAGAGVLFGLSVISTIPLLARAWENITR